MSAAATAAGYLFASGILEKRRQAKAAKLAEEGVYAEPLAEVTYEPKPAPRPVQVTYRRRRI